MVIVNNNQSFRGPFILKMRPRNKKLPLGVPASAQWPGSFVGWAGHLDLERSLCWVADSCRPSFVTPPRLPSSPASPLASQFASAAGFAAASASPTSWNWELCFLTNHCWRYLSWTVPSPATARDRVTGTMAKQSVKNVANIITNKSQWNMEQPRLDNNRD